MQNKFSGEISFSSTPQNFLVIKKNDFKILALDGLAQWIESQPVN